MRKHGEERLFRFRLVFAFDHNEAGFRLNLFVDVEIDGLAFLLLRILHFLLSFDDNVSAALFLTAQFLRKGLIEPERVFIRFDVGFRRGTRL